MGFRNKQEKLENYVPLRISATKDHSCEMTSARCLILKKELFLPCTYFFKELHPSTFIDFLFEMIIKISS